jgi:hypothetical protein
MFAAPERRAPAVWTRHTAEGHAMGKIMTLAEIESQFESEWVLVEDPQTNEALEVQSGTVRHHSKDRDEVHRRAAALGQQQTNFPVLCHTLPASAGVDGLLRLDFMRGYQLAIDFRNGFVSLASVGAET